MSTDQTPTPTPLDLAALTVIANAIEPLEWTVAFGVGVSVYSNWDNAHGEYANFIAGGLSSEEAAHIAAFDPPTALALIARVEMWEKRAEDASTARLDALADAKAATARAEAAEAKIAAVREMHRSIVHTQYGPEACWECAHPYPCPTIAALDGTA